MSRIRTEMGESGQIERNRTELEGEESRWDETRLGEMRWNWEGMDRNSGRVEDVVRRCDWIPGRMSCSRVICSRYISTVYFSLTSLLTFVFKIKLFMPFIAFFCCFYPFVILLISSFPPIICFIPDFRVFFSLYLYDKTLYLEFQRYTWPLSSVFEWTIHPCIVIRFPHETKGSGRSHQFPSHSPSTWPVHRDLLMIRRLKFHWKRRGYQSLKRSY